MASPDVGMVSDAAFLSGETLNKPLRFSTDSALESATRIMPIEEDAAALNAAVSAQARWGGLESQRRA